MKWSQALKDYKVLDWINTVDPYYKYIKDYSIETTPLISQINYLADMARFEWCWYQCFHGPIGNQKLLSSQFALANIWEMCQPEYPGDFIIENNQNHYYFSFKATHKNVMIYSLTENIFNTLSSTEVTS